MNDLKFAFRQWLKNPGFTVVAVLAIGANPASGAGVQNWPRFRGPNGSGVSESRGLPVEFGPGTNLAWRTAVPAGHFSPLAWEKRGFLTRYEETPCIVVWPDSENGKRGVGAVVGAN